MTTVAERIDQIRKDLRDISHALIDSDDSENAIAFLGVEESLAKAHRRTEWLSDQDWAEYTHREIEVIGAALSGTEPPDLLGLLREAEAMAILGDIDEDTETYGWGNWLKRTRAALAARQGQKS